MKKAQFSDAEVAAAVEEFEIYMCPRNVQAGGKNGDVKVYGENPNARKVKVNPYDDDEEDNNGLLQELSN
jgi:hypothetical protein